MTGRWLRRIAVAVVLGGTVLLGAASPAAAALNPPAHLVTAPSPPAHVVTAPSPPAPPGGPTGVNSTTGGANVGVQINGPNGKPSSSIVILLALTVLSVAPALLLMCTSFTKVFVVLSIVRNALGLTSVPPNQVLAGLALFLSLFIMGPVLSDMNHQGVQPYLRGDKSQSVAFHDGVEPLRKFMLAHTRPDEIALFVKAAKAATPPTPQSVPLTTLIPAFVLSELRAAFIIGFVVYIPFLVVDMVVSASLMSMGMMMLPPVTVSLPFKMLLFVMVNGWGLVITALVASY